jgi:outer membrane protein
MMLPAGAEAETETLERAWIEAYRLNPSLQAERAGLRATDEGVAQAQSHWRPTIQATGNIGKTYQYIPSQQQFGTANFADTTRGYGVQLTQPLFRGFRTDSETEAAEKQVLSGRAKLSDAEQQLFLDTATAFLHTLRDESILDIQHQNEHVLEEKLKETGVRARLGELTQTDVEQAASRLARSRVARLQAESALANDRASYMRLVGHAPEKLKAPQLTVDKNSTRDDILHFADTVNPKVIAAHYDVEQSRAEIDLTKGGLLPELDLVGNSGKNWGQSSTLPGRFDNDQVLLQLTMPLYDGGATYSKTRAAEQTATQKLMTLEDVRRKSHETADNAWEALRESEAALDADTIEVEASARAYEGVKVQSKAGTRTTLDVLNAEQEWLDAKTDLLKSQHDRDLAILQITAAIGQLTVDTLKLPVEQYDPEQHYHDVRHQWIGFSKDDSHYMADVPPTEAALKIPPQIPPPHDAVPETATIKEAAPAPVAPVSTQVSAEAANASTSFPEPSLPRMTPNNLNKKIPVDDAPHDTALDAIPVAVHEPQAVPPPDTHEASP